MRSLDAPVPDVHTKRRLRKFATTVVVVLVLGFLAVHHVKANREFDLDKATKDASLAPPVVAAVIVQKAPVSLPLTLPGETAAWYESVIYARVDGYVGSWSANIGDHVQKGQVLATIDTPDLDAQLTASKAKLKASQALVVARQADADFAKTTYARWKDSPKGVVSEQERAAKKAGYDSAIAQLNEAQAQVGLDQADVERFSVLAQFKKVTAPFDGTITERHIDIGNLVTSGSTSSTTSLYRIVQDDPIRVFVDVPQSAAQDIKTGLVAHMTASNIPNHTFDGTVARTADSIDAQTRTLKVEVDIPNTDHALVAGMYVQVAFELPSAGLIQVPAAALVYHSKGPQIAVIKNGRLDFHNVAIARDNGGTVEIASGIDIGDKVALNVGDQAVQGQAVSAQDAANGETVHAQN